MSGISRQVHATIIANNSMILILKIQDLDFYIAPGIGLAGEAHMLIRSHGVEPNLLNGTFTREELSPAHDPHGTPAALRPAPADRLNRYPSSLQGDENGGYQIGFYTVTPVENMYARHRRLPSLM